MARAHREICPRVPSLPRTTAPHAQFSVAEVGLVVSLAIQSPIFLRFHLCLCKLLS